VGFHPRFNGGFEDHPTDLSVHGDQMVYQGSAGQRPGTVRVLPPRILISADGNLDRVQFREVPSASITKVYFLWRDDDRTVLHFIYGNISRLRPQCSSVPGRHFAKGSEKLEVGLILLRRSGRVTFNRTLQGDRIPAAQVISRRGRESARRCGVAVLTRV